jgi:hypothetical protein
VTDEALNQMLHAWFGHMARMLKPGRTLYIRGKCAFPGGHVRLG